MSPLFAERLEHGQMFLENILTSPLPVIEIKVERDRIDGLNVLLNIRNYLMNSPLDKAKDAELLQGHAHVFANGKKKQRLYVDAIHITEYWLRNDVNQIAVSLNSHRFENWTKGGKTVMASLILCPDFLNTKFVKYLIRSADQHHWCITRNR